MAHRLIDMSADNPAAFKVVGTFPSMKAAKAEIATRLALTFGSRPVEVVAEDDTAHDGYDLFAYSPGAGSVLFAVNPA